MPAAVKGREVSAAIKGGWLRTRGVGCSQRRVAEDERCRLQSKEGG